MNIDPYITCPEFETEHFLIRLIQLDDAEALLSCYGDPKAQPLFNADNCLNGFSFSTAEEIEYCIHFWLKEYEAKSFIRLAIVDKNSNTACGTIEYFAYNPDTGLLRLDISSRYEQEQFIIELLNICTSQLNNLFQTKSILTKAIPAATERIAAFNILGFQPTKMDNGFSDYFCWNSYSCT